MIYKFPNNAKFGKSIPKSKIYEKAKPTAKIKELFIKEVDKIIWSYKLSPETINLSATETVKELQLFTIVLKTPTLKYEVLSLIDKAIPFPIIFILNFQNRISYVAAYKRQSESDKTKWVVSDYFATEWFEQQETDQHSYKELPVVLDMAALYEALLKELIPLSPRADENIQTLVERFEHISRIKRESEKLAKKLKKEKQFKRKVEFNAQLRKLHEQIEKLY